MVLPSSAINPPAPTPEVTTTPTTLVSAGSEFSDTITGLDLASTMIGAIGGIVIIGVLFLVSKGIRRGK